MAGKKKKEKLSRGRDEKEKVKGIMRIFFPATKEV